MPRRRIIPFLSILLLPLAVSSCSRKPETLHILTDRKELAQAVEIYGADRPGLIITLRHVKSIDDAAILREKPDLVIGANLAAREILEFLDPAALDDIDDIDAEISDYPVLKGPEDSRSRPYLIPISFELPLIMGERGAVDALPDPSTVSPGELRTAAGDYLEYDRQERLVRMGFSPSWDPQSYVDLLMVRNPRALENGVESLNEEDLAEMMTEAAEWAAAAAGDVESDAEFDSRYRYAPDERLIIDGRIVFARTDFASWAALPETTSRRLGLRYLRGERSIPVVSICAAGICADSKAAGAAGDFIAWLRSPETQRTLMDRWERDGITVFGYFGGLSADAAINNTAVVARWPEMEGMIPEGHYLSAPATLPHRWLRIRDEVLAPWLARSAKGEETLSLAETYRKWDLSSLVETD